MTSQGRQYLRQQFQRSWTSELQETRLGSYIGLVANDICYKPTVGVLNIFAVSFVDSLDNIALEAQE